MTTQMPRNIFEHHHGPHDDGHDHDEQPLTPQRLDPAQQSLADALRVSFRVLKVLMLALLVYYLFSGFFYVAPQQAAVRLRFGRIVQGGDNDLASGRLHFALPYPIERVVFVNTAPQQLNVDRAFWYRPSPAGQSEQQQPGPIDPMSDGSLITGDANIIHLRLSVTYVVKDAVNYLINVGEATNAQALVQAAVEEGVVITAAQTTADQVSKGDVKGEIAQGHAQDVLNHLKTGIEITGITVAKPVFPVDVSEAFNAVINAESRKAQLVSEAYKGRANTLGAVAGKAADPLWNLVHEYERALQGGDTQRIEPLQKQLDEVFDKLTIRGADGLEQPIIGEVGRVITEAQAYRDTVMEDVASEAARFSELMKLDPVTRRIYVTRVLEDAREKVMGGNIETFYLPSGQVYLDLSRDPKIARDLERESLELKAQEGAQPPR